MTHQFNIKSTICGVSLSEFKYIAATPPLHEAICRRLSGDHFEIIESRVEGNVYILRQVFHADVKMPQFAKKLLKDAFWVRRQDTSNIEQLTSTIRLKSNVPFHASCQRIVTGDAKQILVQSDWTLHIKAPFFRGMLERHAEAELRRYSEIEMTILEDELKRACLSLRS